MPKIRCLCDEVINLSVIPNRQEFKLIWEPKIEQIIDSLVNAHQQAASNEDFEKQAYDLFYLKKPKFPQVYECPNCKRLIVFASAADKVPAFWYQQELANTETDSLRSLVEKTVDNQADEA
ncbi:hypothetical protein [Nostoc sp. PCC 7107]|uniref:hypothetical protein n=1 Tax=Nostoc sp. PCC 7107 TaxID=317936 RepID=UPI00029EF955|nr:hypothetical protein [Nostoc sp. PCC 7107]AFY41155.1 hypothetical protein Nos7107_0482 [Nostoc sp. PCC 7107]